MAPLQDVVVTGDSVNPEVARICEHANDVSPGEISRNHRFKLVQNVREFATWFVIVGVDAKFPQLLVGRRPTAITLNSIHDIVKRLQGPITGFTLRRQANLLIPCGPLAVRVLGQVNLSAGTHVY
jgi:hypothetical protein